LNNNNNNNKIRVLPKCKLLYVFNFEHKALFNGFFVESEDSKILFCNPNDAFGIDLRSKDIYYIYIYIKSIIKYKYEISLILKSYNYNWKFQIFINL